jgi:hypothetical protein
MIANLLVVYGLHTDRLIVRRFLVCSSEFDIAVVDCEFFALALFMLLYSLLELRLLVHYATVMLCDGMLLVLTIFQVGVRMVNYFCKLQRRLRSLLYDTGKFTAKSSPER